MIKIYNKDTNFEEEIKEGKVIIDFLQLGVDHVE